MNGVYDISIDYEKTIKQANKLTRIARDCKELQNDLKKEIKYIENNWDGKTGKALADKLRELKKKNASVAENIERVSQTMKRIANDIKQADLESSDRIRSF